MKTLAYIIIGTAILLSGPVGWATMAGIATIWWIAQDYIPKG